MKVPAEGSKPRAASQSQDSKYNFQAKVSSQGFQRHAALSYLLLFYGARSAASFCLWCIHFAFSTPQDGASVPPTRSDSRSLHVNPHQGATKQSQVECNVHKIFCEDFKSRFQVQSCWGLLRSF